MLIDSKVRYVLMERDERTNDDKDEVEEVFTISKRTKCASAGDKGGIKIDAC